MLPDAVALGGSHDVDVVDVARLVLRELADLAQPELPVARCRLAAERFHSSR